MRHRFSGWFRRSYNDAQLAFLARKAIAEDPLLPSVTRVSITSVKGVIRVAGRVHKRGEKERIEANIRTALRTASLRYARLVNTLYLG